MIFSLISYVFLCGVGGSAQTKSHPVALSQTDSYYKTEAANFAGAFGITESLRTGRQLRAVHTRQNFRGLMGRRIIGYLIKAHSVLEGIAHCAC
jgi:hypothetical protein